MKKFIKGAYQLSGKIDDADAFVSQHNDFMEYMIDWADELDVEMSFGFTEDNSFVCQYKIVCFYLKDCKEIRVALRRKLKTHFPKVTDLWQASGDQLW